MATSGKMKMAQGKITRIPLLLALFLTISSCTPCWGLGRNEIKQQQQLWIANPASRRTASSLVMNNHHDTDEQRTIQQTETTLTEAAARSSPVATMVMPGVAAEEMPIAAAAAAADTSVVLSAVTEHHDRNLAQVDVELHNPRAPVKRTPDNIPEVGAIPKDELARLDATAAAAVQAPRSGNASNSSSNEQQNGGHDKNEGVIIAVATLVPLAVLAASFMVLRKTQRSRSDMASSHLSPDFAAPDMSFPAGGLAPHRLGGMSFGGSSRGGGVGRVMVSSTLDTIPEEQEDLVGGKSPFRFRGIV
jgi:hypothetical protein